MISKFQKGQSTFICTLCGKLTRKTVASNVGEECCGKCIEMMEQENSVSDNRNQWDKKTLEIAEKEMKKMEDEFIKRKNEATK